MRERGIVYKIVNKHNGKVYIGKTVRTLAERWAEHVRDSSKINNAFYQALREHGVDGFTVEQIDEVDARRLNAIERQYISEYKSLVPNGYNTRAGERPLDHLALSKFADRLKKYRERSGLTQKRVAELVGVSSGTIRSLERGFREPGLGLLRALSGAFDVPLSELLHGL